MSDIGRMRVPAGCGIAIASHIGGSQYCGFRQCAVHDAMGVPDVSLNENSQRVRKLIGEPDHLVLVLADGFGMNFIEGLDRDAFLPDRLAAEMRTCIPCPRLRLF